MAILCVAVFVLWLYSDSVKKSEERSGELCIFTKKTKVIIVYIYGIELLINAVYWEWCRTKMTSKHFVAEKRQLYQHHLSIRSKWCLSGFQRRKYRHLHFLFAPKLISCHIVHKPSSTPTWNDFLLEHFKDILISGVTLDEQTTSMYTYNGNRKKRVKRGETWLRKRWGH